jgi:hypothetical protein
MTTDPETPPTLITRYADAQPAYAEAGYVAIPVNDQKKPVGKGWTKKQPTEAEVAERLRLFPNANFGLLAGTALSTGNVLAFVDVDHDAIVAFVLAVLSGLVSGKKGNKGLTAFMQARPGMRSSKVLGPQKGKPLVEFFVTSGQVVIPGSMHPTGRRYEWLERPLLDLDHAELPELADDHVRVIEAVLSNEHAWAIIEGGADVAAHQPMLSLTSSGIAMLTDHLEWLAGCLQALFHPDYRGNTKAEILGMLQTAKTKNLGARGTAIYDPGVDGPIPLGFSKDGNYVFLDPVRQIIIPCSSTQLLSPQFLVGLAPSEFWEERFPSKRGGFSGSWAGEALIAAARKAGPFIPTKVRGRGVWREGDRVVVNLGEPVASEKHLYLCFEPIPLVADATFDAARLLDLLRLFNWRNPQDAMLVFGWLAMAPICGVLNWRPHCFVYGPARSGKTTIHTIASMVLAPLVVTADGQSSEAGIRQSLGPDSLPVMIDEFESDQNGSRLQAVIRLARSASSAEAPVLKGTPEGKAMTFSLRAAFFFAAINPRGLSPADQTRILMLELLMHDNDPEKARKMIEEEAYFRSLGAAWCSYMLANAGLIQLAIDIMDRVIVAADRRHRQNLGTLLAAGFVALHGRVPTIEEATALAEEYRPSIERHALETERDDAMECLDFLLSHVVDDYPLSHWLAAERDRKQGQSNDYADTRRIVAMHDMIVETSGERAGVLIRNGSPALERIFERTRWEQRGWQRALRKLAGAFSLPAPVTFATGQRDRVIGIPLSYLPDEPFPLSPGRNF